jgi:CRISPR-associated protein Csd1
MLDQLARYAEREGLVTEPGFAPKNVRWAILVGEDGKPTGEILDLAGDDEKKRQGRRFMRAPNLSLGEMKRGGTGTRHFLADALEVVIRLGGEDDPKVAAKNDSFLAHLGGAEEVVPELATAARHLADPAVQARLRKIAVELKAKPTENATFAVRRSGAWVYPLDDDRWHDWWRAYRATLQPAAKKLRGKTTVPVRMRCMMTGELVEPAPTQPKIKGLASVGGHSSGDVLAAFKQDSFRSYGLVQAENAPVSAEAAARYTTALNRLIRRGKRFQHAVMAHWYEKCDDTDFDPAVDLDLIEMFQGLDDQAEIRDKQRQAAELLDAIRRGDPGAQAIGRTPFHAYTLSGASGRVMVRDVIDGPFTELLAAHVAWFGDLAICRRDDETRRAPPPKFYAVLAATVRDLKEVPAPLETALWRSALRAKVPIPRDALARALARARIDVIQGDVPLHARFGLIKAAINRAHRLELPIAKEVHPVKQALDEDHPDSAYHCGRLMAVLAALQYSALGDVGAGVIQRYYAAASTSPALVLGRLLRNAQFHLNKLDAGLRVWYEKKIAAILGHVERQFPTNLDLENQSLFALGYYQQQAHDRTKKPPAGEAIEQAESDVTTDQE